ncbi:tetratricopeptide repeat protein [bacterium]|nr:tetratricopeptide repeat protein [bacterium]
MNYNKLLKNILTIAILCCTTGTTFAAIATDAKLQYNKGIDYYKLGQFEEAASCFKNAIELDPNYIDAYYNLGSILEYLKQDEAALSVFKQIILRKPEDYESVYKAAALSKKLGETEKAKMYLTLIPTDSMIGQQAKVLADSMETETPTYETPVSETPTEEITENITTQVEPKDVQETTQEVKSVDNNVNTENNANYTNRTYDDISSPTGIVADKNGNLYVAGFSDNTIYKIDSDNKKIVYIKSEKIDGPIGLAIDNTGNIYIANYNKDNIVKVDTNGSIAEFASNIPKPYCMYINNGLLFISSQGSNSVVRYKL